MSDENLRFKVPRTLHLPWSDGGTGDDLRQTAASGFAGRDVAVSEKCDGQSASVYSDGFFHTRSVESRYHESQWPVRQAADLIVATRALPDGWRIQLENCYAKHSIRYSQLPSYLFLIFVWDDQNTALDWQSTREWSRRLKEVAGLERLETVPELYVGEFDEKLIRERMYTEESRLGGRQEGYVIRLAESFSYENFSQSVAKWVRENHVQTSPDWRRSEVQVNGLADDDDS